MRARLLVLLLLYIPGRKACVEVSMTSDPDKCARPCVSSRAPHIHSFRFFLNPFTDGGKCWCMLLPRLHAGLLLAVLLIHPSMERAAGYSCLPAATLPACCLLCVCIVVTAVSCAYLFTRVRCLASYRLPPSCLFTPSSGPLPAYGALTAATRNPCCRTFCRRTSSFSGVYTQFTQCTQPHRHASKERCEAVKIEV